MNKGNSPLPFRIGFLIDNIISIGKYQNRIWEGANEAALKNNVELVSLCGGTLDFSPVNPYEKRRNAVYELVNTNNLAGLIILTTVGSFVEEDRFGSFINEFSSIPIVSVGRPLEEIPCVVEENYDGMKSLVEHFVKVHNRKRIAFIRGPLNIAENTARFIAYKDVLIENKIEYDPDLVFTGNLMPESGKWAIDYFLDEKEISFDALVAVNDNMALGAMAELKKRGIVVPSEVIVGGYDDIEEAEVANPPITTVKAPVKELGYVAIELLLKILRKETGVIKEILPSRLVIRESCGCFRTLGLKESVNRFFKEEGFFNLKDKKEEIVYSVFKKFDFSFEGQMVRIGLDILFDSFIKDIEEKNSTRHFISSLSLILSQFVESGINALLWHGVILAFRDEILKFLNERQIVDMTYPFWDSAFLLIANYAYRMPKYQLLQFEKQSENLRSVSTSIMTLYDVKKLTDTVVNRLIEMNVQFFFMFIYERVVLGKNCIAILSGKIKLVAACANGKKLDTEKFQKTFSPKSFIDGVFSIVKEVYQSNLRLLVIPLYFRNNNFGFLVYESEIDKNIIFETIASQISNVIMSSLLYKERLSAEKKLKSAMTKLADLNKKLERLSFIDELTGLYNRRAFYVFAEQQRNIALRTRRNFLVLFFDMDGLKKINDKYGHKEGDEAIRYTADILKSSFRISDIIARIGGDEFVVIALDAKLDNSENILRKLKANIRSLNERWNKPYIVSLSYGVSEFNPQKEMDLQTLLGEADEQLYIRKKKRKKLMEA